MYRTETSVFLRTRQRVLGGIVQDSLTRLGLHNARLVMDRTITVTMANVFRTDDGCYLSIPKSVPLCLVFTSDPTTALSSMLLVWRIGDSYSIPSIQTSP